MIFENRYLAGDHLSILIKNKIQDFSWMIIVWILRWWAQITQKVSENLWIKATFLPTKSFSYKWQKIWVVAPDWSTVFNKALIWKLWIDPEVVKNLQKEAFEEAKLEKERYDLHMNNFEWRSILVLDDWIITWLTAALAWKYLKQHWASKLIFATPVANSRIIDPLRKFYNEIIVADAVEDRNFWLSKFYMSYYSLWTEDVYEIVHKMKDENLRLS